VGIVFDFDPNQSKFAKIRYLSKNQEVKFFDREDPNEYFKPVIQQIDPGVIEMAISFDNQDSASMFLFYLQTWLGHGITCSCPLSYQAKASGL